MKDYALRIVEALGLWSRLPVAGFSGTVTPDMTRLAPAVPLAGALLGLGGALLLVVFVSIGLPAYPATIFACAAVALLTGAMHEDGLADMADGFGGGATVQRKLEIMQDSRLGSYGAVALFFALSAKISLIAALVSQYGAWHAGSVMIAAAAVCRIAGMLPLALLPPAQQGWVATVSQNFSMDAWYGGAALGCMICLVLVWPVAGFLATLAALCAGFAAAWAVVILARRQVGGQTGDICGAATLLSELAGLAVILAFGHA